MINKESRNSLRYKRKARIRKRVFGLGTKPRLAVFRSNKYLYAQLIDDLSGKTLVAADTKNLAEKSGKRQDHAKQLGKAIAQKAASSGINEVVFDRAGYKYHGIIKTFADSAREGGLKF